MHPTVKAGRIAGLVYLAMVIVAPFSMLYVPGKLIVPGNPSGTAENILAHETMFRLAIFGDLIGHVIFICLGIALYRLLSEVSKTWAALMVALVLVSAAVGFVLTFDNIAALLLFRGGDFLAVLDKVQRDALGMFFIRLHTYSVFADEIFWGVWLLPFGLLVYRSGFLPRLIGLWLIIECFAWVVVSAIGVFCVAYYDAAFKWLQPAFFAELAIMLYLLIKGANVSSLSTGSGSAKRVPLRMPLFL